MINEKKLIKLLYKSFTVIKCYMMNFNRGYSRTWNSRGASVRGGSHRFAARKVALDVFLFIARIHIAHIRTAIVLALSFSLSAPPSPHALNRITQINCISRNSHSFFSRRIEIELFCTVIRSIHPRREGDALFIADFFFNASSLRVIL